MRRWLCLLAVAACGEDVVPDGPPLRPSDDLLIVAHQDDDLLFMEPDLADLLASRAAVTTVYVTAGDGGNGLGQATTRMAAIRSAYGLVVGSQAWTCGWIIVEDQPVSHCRLADRDVSIVTLGLPDGGTSATVPQALLHLFEGSADHADTISAHPARYTRDSLIAALGDVVSATQPARIRTLDIAGTHGPDHPDHEIVGTLAVLARAAAGSDAALISYRGYNIGFEQPMIPDALADAASLPMRAYEACALGCGVACGAEACPTLTDHRYASFVRRHYASDSRDTPATAMLRSPAGCLRLTSDGAALGACNDGALLTFAPTGQIRSGDVCLELDAMGGAHTTVDCTAAPARAFLVDDEGHVWAGIPADSTQVTMTMHALCLAPIEGAPAAVVCGADSDPTWHVERPLVRTTHAAMGLRSSGRTVRLGDLTGDGRADLCTVTAEGLMCAEGDGAGHFARAHRLDAADAPLEIEPDSLALGDVDGDGIADACGTGKNGIQCATSTSKLRAQPALTALPASCIPASLAIADAALCASDSTGLRCAVYGVSSPELVSTWPHARAVALGDLDGDGTPDWCVSTDAGPACGLAADRAVTTDGLAWGYSRHGAIEGSPAVDGTVTDAMRAIGDVSGDGRADLCEIVGQRVVCAVSEGRAFGPRATWLELPDAAEPTALWLGDLDGDGTLDPCVDTPTAVFCALSP